MVAPEERSAGLFPLSAPHVPSADVLWPNIWSKQPQEERCVWADGESVHDGGSMWLRLFLSSEQRECQHSVAVSFAPFYVGWPWDRPSHI